jgi:hypothetical protein
MIFEKSCPNVITKPIRPYDIDGTLIVNPSPDYTGELIYIKDPLENRNLEFRVNKAMVRLMKEESHRGNYIVVWSRSGWEWARNVIDALGLTEYVSGDKGIIMDKPLVYFDDQDVSMWLKDRVYLGPDERYKE